MISEGEHDRERDDPYDGGHHHHGHGGGAAEAAREDLAEASRELVDLQAAESILQEAEHRAEERVRNDLAELERTCETEIVVNGQRRIVPGHEVTFEEVIAIGFPGVPAQQNAVFSMTFHHAAQTPHSGELSAGGRVHVKKGSRFNVTRTVQS